MMPDLPNVGWERDLESFREFFENPAFRSDGLKVYPTLVIRGTGLYELWKRGLYRNYPPDKASCAALRCALHCTALHCAAHSSDDGRRHALVRAPAVPLVPGGLSGRLSAPTPRPSPCVRSWWT